MKINEWGQPEKGLPGGRVAVVDPLTFGRGRVSVFEVYGATYAEGMSW